MGFDQVRFMLTSAVEVVVTTRRGGDSITRAQSQAIAATCLRACGVPDERIEYVAAVAMKLISTVDGPAAPTRDDVARGS